MYIFEAVEAFDTLDFLARWHELTGRYPFDVAATFSGVRS